jgi:hypothetical protein
MGEVKPALEKAGFFVVPTSYGRFGVPRFLSPFIWLRQEAIRRVASDIRLGIRSYKQMKRKEPQHLSVIAHSFGTYVVGRILLQFPEFTWDRVIFCGSVVRDNFPFDQVLERFHHPLINEVGSRDFWPALAESAGWGYGSVGSTGFNRPPVETRWHKGFRHSDFLSDKFCTAFWTPFLEGERPKRADKPVELPLWIRAIAWFPLRWILAGLVVALPIFGGLSLRERYATIYSHFTRMDGSIPRDKLSLPQVISVPADGIEAPKITIPGAHLWENVDVNKNDVGFAIKNHIFCETVDALRQVRSNIMINGRPAIPDSYDVHVQLTLTSEEPATNNPSVARADKSSTYYNVGKITARGANTWCRDPQLGISPLDAAGSLGIGEFLSNAFKGLALLGGKNESFSYETKFAVITNDSIGPAWKLVHLAADTKNLPIVRERTRTHDLILTFGPGTR